MKRKLTLFITLCLCTVLILSAAFTAQADNVSDAGSSSVSGDTSETSEASSVSESSESESTSESSVSSSSSEEVQTEPDTDEAGDESEGMTETDSVSDVSESEEVQETQEEQAGEPQQDPWEVMEGMKAELINKTSVDYVGLYVRPSMTDEWSQNLLSEDYKWTAGSEVRFVVPDGYNESDIGLFDVKAVAADGTETEIIFVPLIDKVYGGLYTDEGATLISISDERLVAEEQYVTSEEIAKDNETSKEALKDALVEAVNNNG